MVGLTILKAFLDRRGIIEDYSAKIPNSVEHLNSFPKTSLVKRVIACLDVRSNDQGDLVVTKGDQYDVRENAGGGGRGEVRNLGLPVALCERYYKEGADEIVFLNITSFRQGVIDDMPMLQVLENSSERCFVPLTVIPFFLSFSLSFFLSFSYTNNHSSKCVFKLMIYIYIYIYI